MEGKLMKKIKAGTILVEFTDPEDGEHVVLRYITPKRRRKLFSQDSMAIQDILSIQASMEADGTSGSGPIAG